MKYAKSEYEQTDFYGPDEDMESHTQKVVKTRTLHNCCQCQTIIPSGDSVLLETCFMDGPQRAYTCIACCDKWLEQIKELI